MTSKKLHSDSAVVFRFLRTFTALFLLCLTLFGCSVSGAREEYDTESFQAEGDDGKTDLPVSGTPKKRVAITYDDGPHNVRTKQIVDELAKYGWHATFFVVGNRVDGTEYAGGDAMLYALRAGNEVGIHGYTHKYSYETCSDSTYHQELAWTAQAIREKKPGYKIDLMRPIGGNITAARAAACEYAVIMWSVDPEDYKYKGAPDDETQQRNVNTIVENVLSDVSDGDIILMHDLYQNTYEATVIILARLYEMGYDVVTVSELLGDDLQPGKTYREQN